MDKEIIGIAAGILTAASLVPQLTKTLREKKAEMSPVMFILLIGGNGLWTYYGIQQEDAPIIVTNSFAFLMDLIMLFLKFKYRNNT